VEVHPIIAANRYLGPHVSYIIREYRVTAYTQFLDAYKRSVCPHPSSSPHQDSLV
jgi:hypothetical protein